jgi:hypothetical protein
MRLNWTPFASGCGKLLKTELREVESRQADAA